MKTMIITTKDNAFATKTLLMCSGIKVTECPLDDREHPIGDYCNRSVQVNEDIIAVWAEPVAGNGSQFVRLMCLALDKKGK
ncbi:hypothetical protein EKL85_21675 [Salmonella enterica subsp. enterica serovar Give]|nr:hypothetical protein [Salmonella enterica subsp. enterica serovar Give]ECA4141892.1 hypothetical protein [Salmonella enterica subsp. enterica serovar Give]